MTSLSSRKIISAFSFMSGATLLTIIMGMATNKLIAVYAGTEGIGIVSLFRNFIGFLVPVLTAGTTTVIVQMISTSSSPARLIEIVKSVFNLFIIQLVVVIILATFFSGYISNWLFPNSNNHEYIDEVRIVFSMAIIVLFSQSMVALINGKVNIKKISVINIATALSTLIMVYPLVHFGGIGYAFIVGSGSIVGAIIGFLYVSKIYKRELDYFSFSVSAIKKISTLPVSLWLFLHPLFVSAIFLNIQVVVNKYYGINALGIYSAVVMLESTTIMLLMAGMKAYYLPMLGKLSSRVEKENFINKVLTLLILVISPFIIFLIFSAKYILWFLFSEEFIVGEDILKLQSLAMLAQVFSWCYAMYFLHESRYKIYFMIDAVWALFLSISIWYIASSGFPLASVALIYFIGSLISFSLYLVVIYRFYGKGFLNVRNTALGAVSFLAILAAYFTSKNAAVSLQILFVVSIFLVFSYFMGINYKRLLG